METILALGGRRTSPPQNDARQPRLVRLDQWIVVLGSLISLFGLLLQAQAATSVTLAWNPSGASGIAGYRPTAHWSIGSGLGKRQGGSRYLDSQQRRFSVRNQPSECGRWLACGRSWGLQRRWPSRFGVGERDHRLAGNMDHERWRVCLEY